MKLNGGYLEYHVQNAVTRVNRCSYNTEGATDRFQGQVKRWLSDLLVGVTVQANQLVLGIETDLTLSLGKRKVIVECDGDAYHLTNGPDGGTPHGRDIIQDKVLGNSVGTVVHIRDSEFYPSDKNKLVASRELYLKKIKCALGILPGAARD